MNMRSLLSKCGPVFAVTALSSLCQPVPASQAPTALSGTDVETLPSPPVEDVVDAPLEPYRLELLQLGFETAATFPDNHHFKNRGRALEVVATACFELDQPHRALGYIEHITNWRRGAGYADFALHCIDQGVNDVDAYLDRALEVASTSKDALDQEWRADSIRSKVAVARLLLGDTEAAARIESGLEASQVARAAGAKARFVSDAEFEAALAEQKAKAALGDFDLSRASIEAHIGLFDRFFDDEARCAQVQAGLVEAWAKVPLMVRVEARLDLAEIAVGRFEAGGDADTARRGIEQLEHVEAYFESHRWKAEDKVPLLSRLSVLRNRAGDLAGAKAQLEAALALYGESREGILNFDRARTLRPVAVAYAARGQTGIALATFRRVVEEGAVNPNLKPRIDDLTGTCAAMAKSAVEPDPELWEQMRAIQAELAARSDARN